MPARGDRATTDGHLVQPIKIARAYEQLAGLLRERITSGELGVGDRLPSESALAKQAGVSRSTVREALRILEQGGLVERASPRIMVVAERSDNPSFRELRRELRRHNLTFHHLHEALLTIDPELTRLAAIRADKSDLQALHSNLDEQEEHLDHLAEWSRLDVEFHATIAELSANPALIIAREPISQVLLPALYRFMDTREMAEHATNYHRRIISEIEVRDPDTAAAVMRRHINDWRAAWEHRGLDLHQEVLDLSYTTRSEPNTVISPHHEDEEERPWASSRAPRRSPV
ncbi:MAG TPA: FCD domain-containing protein [Solirubrobacterales bacterium]|jgi:DNA-binding FadR family transcriptional regulator|nr:FCD domain-containing protein [Solirubrobacterales bacterium]